MHHAPHDIADVIGWSADVGVVPNSRPTFPQWCLGSAAVQHTDTTAASGPIAFDEFGDTRTKVFTIYRVTDGRWQPIKTAAVP